MQLQLYVSIFFIKVFTGGLFLFLLLTYLFACDIIMSICILILSISKYNKRCFHV